MKAMIKRVRINRDGKADRNGAWVVSVDTSVWSDNAPFTYKILEWHSYPPLGHTAITSKFKL